MEVAFWQILRAAENEFQRDPHFGGSPYHAMENAARAALENLSDEQIALLLSSRPNAFGHKLKAGDPRHTNTLRDAAIEALVVEVVLGIDITFLEPREYRGLEFRAPDYLRDKVRNYLAGPKVVSATRDGNGFSSQLGA
jgi:hypothetical protein